MQTERQTGGRETEAVTGCWDSGFFMDLSDDPPQINSFIATNIKPNQQIAIQCIAITAALEHVLHLKW